MAHWWNGYPWRVIQPNFREIDTKDFNEEAFLASLKDFSCNAVMLNAAGLIASYPTQLQDHTRSAYLDGFDLKRLVDRCHEQGVKVIARTDFSKIPVSAQAGRRAADLQRHRADLPLRRLSGRVHG